MKVKIRNYIIKNIQAILWWSLRLFSFSKVKEESKEFLNLKQIYERKKVSLVPKRNIVVKTNATVIIPVYNGEKTIKKCLQSLVNQKTKYTYNIVVIDDGSTDQTAHILNEFGKRYGNIVVIHQENKGISEARNLGLSYVTGEYIAFIDSDDFVSEDYLEKLLSNGYERNAAIVRCNYYEYDIEKNVYIKSGKEQNDCVLKGDIGSRILDFKGYPWGGIFKTSLWEEIQFPEGYWYEDMIIRMILFRRARVFSYINDKLYYYCLHENNISKVVAKTSDRQCLDHFFLINHLCYLSNELGLQQDKALFVNVLYEYSVVLWLRTRKLEKKLRKSVFLESCKIIEGFGIDERELSKEQRLLVSIIKKSDYIRWNLYAIYKMLSVKYGV